MFISCNFLELVLKTRLNSSVSAWVQYRVELFGENELSPRDFDAVD